MFLLSDRLIWLVWWLLARLRPALVAPGQVIVDQISRLFWAPGDLVTIALVAGSPSVISAGIDGPGSQVAADRVILTRLVDPWYNPGCDCTFRT